MGYGIIALKGVCAMKEQQKKESSFMTRLFTGVSLVYILLGGLLCGIPSLKMEYICYGISVTLIVLGIILIVKYFVTESYQNLNRYGFSIGVFMVIIGVCTLVKNRQMTESFQLYIGVCILLTAIIKLQNAMDLKALKDRVWGVIFFVAVVIMAAAIVIIINPFKNHNYELVLTYFSLLFDGIISLFSYNYLAYRLKKRQKQQRASKLAKEQNHNIDSEPSADETGKSEESVYETSDETQSNLSEDQENILTENTLTKGQDDSCTIP